MDYENLIQKLLISDARIRSYVAKIHGNIPNISPNQAPAGIYPLITFERIAGGDVFRAESKPVVFNRVFQLSVYSEDSDFYLIEGVIDELMQELHFNSIFEYSDKNKDTNIIGFSKHWKILSDQALYQRNFNLVQPRFESYINTL